MAHVMHVMECMMYGARNGVHGACHARNGVHDACHARNGVHDACNGVHDARCMSYT